MAEILKNEIKIPVWMFSILLTIMLGLLGFTAANATNRQQILQNGIEITNIKNNEIKTLQADKADKADKAEVVQMQSSLVRIENKLDQWILINRK